MVKAAKIKPTAKVEKKSSRTKVSAATSLKNEFKAKMLELKKQFTKQLKEVKKAAEAKAVAVANELIAKHEQAKSKAVKDAISTVEKARSVKVKADKAQKAALMAKVKPAKVVKQAKATKVAKVAKPVKAVAKVKVKPTSKVKK